MQRARAARAQLRAHRRLRDGGAARRVDARADAARADAAAANERQEHQLRNRDHANTSRARSAEHEQLLAARKPIVVPNVVVQPGGRSYDLNSWQPGSAVRGAQWGARSVRAAYEWNTSRSGAVFSNLTRPGSVSYTHLTLPTKA